MGGKCGVLVLGVGLLGLAALILLNPIASPNFRELNSTLQLIAVILGFVGFGALAFVFGSGSTFVGGSGNSVGNTTNIHIHERGPSEEVRRHMGD